MDPTMILQRAWDDRLIGMNLQMGYNDEEKDIENRDEFSSLQGFHGLAPAIANSACRPENQVGQFH